MQLENNHDFKHQFNHEKTSKTGVLLVNLGTPEQPTPKALKKYLKEFLWDHRVVEIPRLVWWCILNLFVLPFRSKKSAKAYQEVWSDEGSPLLVYSKRLTEKVKGLVDADQYTVELAMRYGQPSVANGIKKLTEQGASKIIVLPLYPQYSGTTTGSTFDAVAKELTQMRYVPELTFVNHYHDHPLYIEALANSVKASWQQHGQGQKIVMSYHGIPKRYWQSGDPYPCHCFKTTRLLTEALGINKEDVITSFQSLFGKAEWVKPYTDATLKQLPQHEIKDIDIICPGFAVDCLETIEEIEQENKEYFIEAGGNKFTYIKCLNDDDAHAALFAALIKENS